MSNRFAPDVIHVDEHGVPFARPERPADDASIDDRIAYMHAVYAYNDRVSNHANRAFDQAFRAALRAR